MRKHWQKLWSMLLTVCLLLSLVPVSRAVAAAGVTIDKDVANIAPNKTVTLTASTSLSSYTLSWSSSDTAIATVTQTGTNTCQVTGVRSGVATVTATLNDGSKDTCTIYVSITNGVYFIRYSSGLYLSVNQGMVEGSQLELLAKKSSGPAQLRQLWKIEHAGQHYYTIRSAYRPDLALNVTNGAVDVATLSTSTPASSALANRKWKISRVSNTYTLNHMGYASRAMQPADTTIVSGTDVIAASDSSAQHTWALEWDDF